MDLSATEITRAIREKCLDLGFDACGISRAGEPEQERNRLQEWLSAGHHGTMAYMTSHADKRVNPSLLKEGAKSVITVLLNYYSDKKQLDPAAPVISKYAYGKDYHHVVKGKLRELLVYIQNGIIPCEGRVFADSAPILEKAFAREAGLGWIGKNTLLINPALGSYVFLGELLLDIELDYDQPFGNSLCGSCSRCMDSCPTGAIIAPMKLDARKCISYLTIETKEEIPDRFAGQLANRLVGCDICQEVCPWNSRAKPNKVPDFAPKDEMLALPAKDWATLDKPTYNRLFKKTAVERAGFSRLKKTLEFLPRQVDQR